MVLRARGKTLVSALHTSPLFHPTPTTPQPSPPLTLGLHPQCFSKPLHWLPCFGFQTQESRLEPGRQNRTLCRICAGRYSETAQFVPDCCEVSVSQVHPGRRRTQQKEGKLSPSNLFHPKLVFPVFLIPALYSVDLRLSLGALSPTHLLL